MIANIATHILSLPPWVALLVVFALPALESSAFVGFIFPGEIALILGGVIAYEGRVSVVAGSIVGDSVGYAVGKRYGRRLLDGTAGRIVKSSHLDRAETYLAARGGRAVFFGRFTAALRVLIPGLAGMSGMRYRTFLVYNVAGAIGWGTLSVMFGYLGGSSWRHVEHIASRVGLAALGAVVVTVLGGILLRRTGPGRFTRLARTLASSSPVRRTRTRFPRAAGRLLARLERRHPPGPRGRRSTGAPSQATGRRLCRSRGRMVVPVRAHHPGDRRLGHPRAAPRRPRRATEPPPPRRRRSHDRGARRPQPRLPRRAQAHRRPWCRHHVDGRSRVVERRTPVLVHLPPTCERHQERTRRGHLVERPPGGTLPVPGREPGAILAEALTRVLLQRRHELSHWNSRRLPAAGVMSLPDLVPASVHRLAGRVGRRMLTREVLTFLSVGGTGYVVDVAAFNALRSIHPFATLDPSVARTLAVVAAMCVTYLGNRTLTWRDEPSRNRRREVSLFVLFNIIGFGFSVVTLAISHDLLEMTSRLADNISANVIGLALGTVFRYLTYKRFVFAAPPAVQEAPGTAPSSDQEVTQG